MEFTKEEQEEAFRKTATVKVQVLVNILKIIDISCKHGIFKPSELSHIGSVYDIINEGVEKAMMSVRMHKGQEGHSVATRDSSYDPVPLPKYDPDLQQLLKPLPPIQQNIQQHSPSAALKVQQQMQQMQQQMQQQQQQVQYNPNVKQEQLPELPPQLRPMQTKQAPVNIGPLTYTNKI